MPGNTFTEGVKPGGLTTGTEVRILLCYLLNTIDTPVSREQIEEVLLGEELANYFVVAEGLAQIVAQGLATEEQNGYLISPAGRSVAQTLARDVPRAVREAAVRGVVRARQYAAKAAAHHSEIVQTENGRTVHCSIADGTGSLFEMALYMPDELSANMVRRHFIDHGDQVYKLVLAALTNNRKLAAQALEALGNAEEDQTPGHR